MKLIKNKYGKCIATALMATTVVQGAGLGIENNTVTAWAYEVTDSSENTVTGQENTEITAVENTATTGAAVTAASINASLSNNNSNIVVKWDMSNSDSDEYKYDVYIGAPGTKYPDADEWIEHAKKLNGGAISSSSADSEGVLSYTINGKDNALESGKDYYVCVIAQNSQGETVAFEYVTIEYRAESSSSSGSSHSSSGSSSGSSSSSDNKSASTETANAAGNNSADSQNNSSESETAMRAAKITADKISENFNGEVKEVTTLKGVSGTDVHQISLSLDGKEAKVITAQSIDTITVAATENTKAYVYVEALNAYLPIDGKLADNNLSFDVTPGASYVVADEKLGTEVNKGWNKTGDTWVVVNGDGSLKTGWFKDYDGKWYNLSSEGKMNTGWMKDNDGKWYKLGESGAMKTGWEQDADGRWYYLNSDGSMAVDQYVEGYYVGSNGAWIQ